MISVENLTKCYGDFVAVKDLSFEIEEGHVYGFLGPNGAGKSTTMNIMTGCLSATEGTVRIDGYDIFEDANKAKRLIGYLPEQPPLYMSETPVEYLRFVGEAKGLRGEELTRQIDEVMELTKITEVANKRISKLSKGFKQRVGIAQAILGNPKVIILDEPTVGLDPIQIIEIRTLIKELGTNHTVILSSHILSEVQTICDQILIIAKGKLLALDTPENLEKNLKPASEIILTTDAGKEEVEEVLASVEGIGEATYKQLGEMQLRVQVSVDTENLEVLSKEVFKAFALKGLALSEMTTKKANLEDVFLELTEQADAEAEAEESLDGEFADPFAEKEEAEENAYSDETIVSEEAEEGEKEVEEEC